ncbi:MAG: ATP-binding cassette domain-containing protein [Chthoniobacterales bacterium]
MSSLHCTNIAGEKKNLKGDLSRVNDISLSFELSSFYAICGAEGCGKNLLLEILGLLERPSSGEIYVEDKSTGSWDDAEQEKFRNHNFGYLLEGWTLLPAFTVVENIAIPYLRHFEARPEDARRAAEEALEFCGIHDAASTLACDLSPRMQEMTAFARAIAHKPKILFAESCASAGAMLSLARAAADFLDMTVIWTGEREALIGYSDRLIEISEGRVICDEPVQRIP